MTEDHKPSREDEQKRIRDAGGFVINNRVMGELAVSRAFGDAEFKKGIQVTHPSALPPSLSASVSPSSVGQSIIDEEGVKLSSNGKDNDEKDSKNWDQPLIIAKPDVEVAPPLPSLLPPSEGILFHRSRP
jgi:serine/threonine protein phosphatase PrpC